MSDFFRWEVDVWGSAPQTDDRRRDDLLHAQSTSRRIGQSLTEETTHKMSELFFAVVMLIGAVIGFIGLGYMVFSPPTAPKVFLIAGLIGVVGFFGYAVLRVRAERQARSTADTGEQEH